MHFTSSKKFLIFGVFFMGGGCNIILWGTKLIIVLQSLNTGLLKGISGILKASTQVIPFWKLHATFVQAWGARWITFIPFSVGEKGSQNSHLNKVCSDSNLFPFWLRLIENGFHVWVVPVAILFQNPDCAFRSNVLIHSGFRRSMPPQ